MRIEFVGTYEECRIEAEKLFGFTSSPAKVKAKKEKVPEVPETVEEPPKEAVETPSEPATTQVEEVLAEAPEAPQNEPESKPEASETGEVPLTLKEVRERMNNLRQACGVEAVKSVLREIGYGKVTDVPAEKYTEMMVLADAAEAGYGSN